MKLLKLLFFLIVFGFNSQIFCQNPSFYNNIGGASTNSFPLNSAATDKAEWIYAPGVFNSSGLTGTPAFVGNITTIYFQLGATVNASSVYSDFTISLGQNVGTTPDYGTVSNIQPFNTGLTQCFYQATYSLTGAVAEGWYAVTLQTPFLYNPAQSLIFELKVSNGTGNAVRQVTTAGVMQRKYADYAAIDGTVNTSLINLGFDLIPATPCLGIPTAGNSTASSILVCNGANVNLSLSGNTISSGLTYQWQSGPSATGPWTNMLNDTTVSVTEQVTAPTYFQCIVTCSGQSSTSTPIFVNVNPNLPAGTYTIGPAGNYPNFTAAAAALSCGIAGPVTFNVLPNSGPYNEQVTIPAILNTSSVNTVTFNCNNNTLSFAPTVTDRHILRLNGADYLTFNDLNILGTDAANGYGILLNNNSDYNSFVNVIVDLTATFANTTTGNAGIAVSGSNTSAITAGSGGANNSFIGCTVKGGYYGITITGTNATTTSSNNLISNCIFEDFYFYGIYVSNISNSQILNNQMRRPNRTVVSSFYGISHLTGGVNNLFEANRIYNGFGAVAVTNTSTTYGLYSTADATVGNENKYFNNLIYDINNNGTAYGIYNVGSDNVKYYHNTISLDHAASTAGTTRGFFQTTAASGIDFKNNIISITRGGSGAKHCVYLGTTTSGVTMNNNNYYINAPSGTNSVGFFSSDQTTLANWQGVNGAIYDINSTSLDPLYVFPITGNFTPNNMALNSLGAALGLATDILGNLRDALYPDMGAFEFGTSAPVLCAGTPTAGTAVTSAGPICSGNPASASMSVSGYTLMPGISLQWQQSSTPGGPYTDVTAGTGATSPNYSSAPISSTTYFVCKVTCAGSNLFSLTNEIVVNVVNPSLTSTQGASLCGVGSLALNATASSGSIVNWYQNQAGGALIATGATFNTPVISSTTTFYAAASSGSSIDSVAIPLATGATTGVYHHMFVVNSVSGITVNGLGIKCNQAIGTLTAWDVYYRPDNYQTIPGANTSATGWTLISTLTNVPSLGANDYTNIAFGLSLNIPAGATHSFYIAPATGVTHQYSTSALGTIVQSNADASIIAGNRGSALFNLTTSGGMATVKLNYSKGCEGARVPVIATISNAPSINGSSNISSICSGNNATLSVTSTNANYTYSWSPGGQTGSSITVNPSSTINYIVTASDNSTGTFAGCTNLDTVSINVQPTLIGIDATPEEHCLTGSSALVLNPSAGYSAGSIEWQTSTNNSTFTTIAGASGANYTTPTLTASTYFKAIIKDANGITCNEMVDSVMVNNPQLISTTAGESCGPNSVLLSANSGPGTTVNWYTTPTGGSPTNTGSTFNTPFIFNSTTYYASAASGGGAAAIAPMPPQGTTFTGNVRGYWFTSPVSFTITGLQAMGTGTGNQSIAVFKFNNAATPPVFSGTTDQITMLYITQNNPSIGTIPVNIPIAAGDVIGVFGQIGTVTSYGTPTGPYVTTIAGQPVTLTRLGMQSPLSTSVPGTTANTNTWVWQEPANAIGRVEITYSTGCESARVPVDASILDLPTVNLGNDTTFCDNISVNLDPGNFVSYAWSTGANSQNISVNTSGTYSVTVTDTNACTNADTIVVTANPTPNPLLSDVSNCTGQAETLNPGVSPAGNTFNWSNGQSTPTISVTSSGTYIVTVTNDGSGCSGIDTAVVNINTAQAIGLNNAIVCDYNSITLTVPSSFTGVTWSTGATGNSVTIAGSSLPVGANNITINAIDANGCATTQTIVLTVDRCLSVSERANSNSIKVYPNPSSGKINVETENISNAVLEVIDLNGRVLLTQKLGNDVKLHNVDLTGASSGMYFLKITGDGFQNVERITIR